MNKESHTFPCDYLIKVIGTNHIDFPQEILNIVKAKTKIVEYKLSDSKNNKFKSLSLLLHLNNEEVLADIYKQIKDKPYIKMIL